MALTITASPQPQTQGPNQSLQALVAQLGDSRSAGAALSRLETRATGSPSQRAAVINAVSVDLRSGFAGGWMHRPVRIANECRVLGYLRAARAAPLLAEHIDFPPVVQDFSLGRYRCAFALAQIGAPAVPALSGVLLSGGGGHEGASRRRLAAEALGRIGGPAATAELRRALKTETADWVRAAIRAALRQATSGAGGSD